MTLQFEFSGVDQKATTSLQGMKKIPAKNTGSLNSAVMSAAYYAKKLGHPMHVYAGNSFMHAVHRVSDQPSQYLSPINNTGDRMLSISPDLVVTWYNRISAE